MKAEAENYKTETVVIDKTFNPVAPTLKREFKEFKEFKERIPKFSKLLIFPIFLIFPTKPYQVSLTCRGLLFPAENSI